MNTWGVSGCREHRDEIIGWLRESYGETTLLERVRAGLALAVEPWFRITDPFGSIVDEAIRRAEVDAPPPSE